MLLLLLLATTICGGARKAQLLQDLGVDRVVDYTSEDVKSVLKRGYPKGVNLVHEVLVFIAEVNCSTNTEWLISAHSLKFKSWLSWHVGAALRCFGLMLAGVT
eukprot:GHUV01014081.1.p2 GENE.GHUV01014081.1~~GHUV01014081.1.p2  ORF type:complete len:103 (+),score=18.41 GHUV01014081.1:570-878(+)